MRLCHDIALPDLLDAYYDPATRDSEAQEIANLMVERLHGSMRVWASRELRDKHSADDVVGDACVKLLDKLSKTRSGNDGRIGTLEWYARRVVANTAQDHRRKIQRESPIDDMPEVAITDTKVGDSVEIAADVWERMWAEILAMKPLTRSAVILSYHPELLDALAPRCGPSEIAAHVSVPLEKLASLWPGLPLTATDIAAILGTTRGNVDVMLHRARKRLGPIFRELVGEL